MNVQKNRNKKKPWYVWLSVFAFVYLASDTSTRVLYYEKKNKIKVVDSTSLWFATFGHLFYLWIVFIIIPGFFSSILINQADIYFGKPISLIINIIALIILYLLGVHVTDKHFIWREKNIKHML